MFERTALPKGPRVISSRLAGARSVSIAAYVLAGSRLEIARGDRRRPLHGAHHVQGHGGLSDDACHQRGDRGRRRLVQRRDRSRVDGLLGARPATRGHAGRWTSSASSSSARSCRPRRSTASARSSSRRSARTATTPSEYAQILFQSALFGDGPLGREICGDEAGIRALPADTIRDVLEDDVPAGATRSWPSPGTSTTRRRSTLTDAAFGTGNGRDPRLRCRRRRCPPGERVRARQARHVAGPARGRPPGPPP